GWVGGGGGFGVVASGPARPAGRPSGGQAKPKPFLRAQNGLGASRGYAKFLILPPSQAALKMPPTPSSPYTFFEEKIHIFTIKRNCNFVNIHQYRLSATRNATFLKKCYTFCLVV
ncbi:MAG: hypothetical protein LBU70_10335, partial [Chitinispirillales bacterium]|nr:hypothetical protein [Chitinispirillales bacterium]